MFLKGLLKNVERTISNCCKCPPVSDDSNTTDTAEMNSTASSDDQYLLYFDPTEAPTTTTTAEAPTTTTAAELASNSTDSTDDDWYLFYIFYFYSADDSTTTTTTTEAPTTTTAAPLATGRTCMCGGVLADPTSATTTSTMAPTTRAARRRCACGRGRARSNYQQAQAAPTAQPAPEVQPAPQAQPAPMLATSRPDRMHDAERDLPISSPMAGEKAACPDGWVKYHESCYYMEQTKMDREQAQKACDEKGAMLFVADSPEEFREIASQSTKYYWSWIGLTQSAGSSRPTWTGAAGMDPTRVKWLITPFSSASNGWSSTSTCAAYYNIDTYSIAYVYFYPCSWSFYSICERNSTLAYL